MTLAGEQKLTIEINGNTVKLDKTLKNVNSALAETKREANALSRELSFEPGNQDLIVKKQKALEQALQLSAQKAEMLNDKLKNIDPDVNPKAFFTLQRQLNQTERGARSLQRQFDSINAYAKRMSRTASSFKFDPGNGAKEFQNSIQGVESALSSIGNKKDILNFKTANTSVEGLKKGLNQTEKALELLNRKATLLKNKLNDVDPKINPKAFTEIQKEINKTNSEIDKLKNNKVDIKTKINADSIKPSSLLGALGSKLKSGFVNILKDSASGAMNPAVSSFMAVGGAIKDATLKAVKSIPNGVKNAFGGIKTVVNDLIVKPIQGINTVASAGLKGLKSIVDNFVIKPFNGVKSAISASFNGIKGVVNTFLIKPFQGVKSAVASSLNGVGDIMKTAIMSPLRGMSSSIKSAFSGLGDVVTKSVTAPLAGLKNALTSGLATIVQGGLLTIGNKITTGVGNMFTGTIKSMQETSVAAKSLENNLQFTGVDDSAIGNIKTDLQEFARASSYSSSSLDKVVASLSTSGMKADKLATTTKNIASAYSLLGDGSRDISEIGVIFSQINSAGKLMAEDFNQLRDAGLGGAIKKDIEDNFPEVIKQFGSFQQAMAQGAISADMVNESINRIGSSKQAQNAALVPKTMKDAFDNLNETIGQKFQSTFEEVNQFGIKKLSDITDKVQDIDVGPITDKVAQVLNMIDGMFDKLDFNKIIGQMSSLTDSIVNMISQIDFRTLSSSAGKAFQSIISMLKSLSASPFFSIINETFTSVFVTITDIVSTISQKLGGAFQSSGFASGLQQVADLTIQVADLFKKFVNDVTSSKAGDVFGASFGVAMTVAKNGLSALELMWDSFSQALKSNGAIDTFESMANKISELSTKLQPLGAFFGTVFAQGIQLVMSLITQLTSEIDTLISKISSIGDSFDLSGISSMISGAFGAGLQAVNTIIESLIATWGTFANNISSGDIQSVLSGLSGTFSNILSTLKPVGELVGKVLASAFIALGPILENVNTITSSWGESIQKFVSNIDIDGLSSKISSAVQFVIGLLTSGFQGVIGIFTMLKNIWDSFTGSLSSDTITTSLGNIQNIFNNIVSTLQPLGDLIGTVLAGAFTALQPVIQTISDIITQIVSQFTAWVSSMSSEDIASYLQPVADILNTGIKMAFDGIKAVIDAIKSSWDILTDSMGTSPMQDTLGSIKLLWDGILSSLTIIGDILSVTFVAALALLQPAVQWVADKIKELSDGMNNLGNFDMGAVIAPFQAFGQAVVDVFNMVFGFGESVIKGLLDVIPAGEIMAWFESISNEISKIAEFLKPVTDFLGVVVGWVAGGVLKLLGALLSDILGSIVGLFEGVSTLFNKIKEGIEWINDKGGKVFDFVSGMFKGGKNNSLPTGATYSSNVIEGSSYSTNSSVVANINVYGRSGQSATEIARAVKHEFLLGTV